MSKDSIEELDLAKFMTLQERVGRLKAQLELGQVQLAQADAALRSLQLELRSKYELGPADSINPDTRAIVRAPAPPVIAVEDLAAAMTGGIAKAGPGGPVFANEDRQG